MNGLLKVPAGTVYMAYIHWFEYHGNVPSYNDFCNFTGVKNFSDTPHVVTPDQVRRLELLAGPHWYALLKAHYASMGVD